MDLRQYLADLDTAEMLQRITNEVSADLEIARLCRAEFSATDGGKALLFQSVKGSPLPWVGNLFGSQGRLERLLRTPSLPVFAKTLLDLVSEGTGTAEQRLRKVCRRNQTLLARPGRTEVMMPADLETLPGLRSWPGEGGRYLTLALVLTRHPESGLENLGLYRVQLQADGRLAINFSPGSGAGEHLAAAEASGQNLPVCLFLGSDPALIWTAAAPLPPACSELAFHRALFGGGPAMSPCETQPLMVPVDAELVMEGEVLAEDRTEEGPFGNHTGSYVRRSDCPVMRVTSVRQRQGAVFPFTVVGPPPSENVFLAQASLQLIRALLAIDYPQVRRIEMPLETIFHGAALLAVEPATVKQNHALITSLWRQGPLRRARLLILLDEDIDLGSPAVCWWRAVNQLPEARIYQQGGQLAIDATGVDPKSLIRDNPVA